MASAAFDQTQLEQLAGIRFHTLTEAERTLLVCATSGESAHCEAPDKGRDDPENSPSYGCH
jgi:hypothetical protein